MRAKDHPAITTSSAVVGDKTRSYLSQEGLTGVGPLLFWVKYRNKDLRIAPKQRAAPKWERPRLRRTLLRSR